MPKLFPISLLHNPVKNYAWGSKTALADLTGIPNAKNEPQAELWMGAHAGAPSLVDIGSKKTTLIDLIKRHPNEILGPAVAGAFSNSLPFLFKVLAAAQPLSIQAHPNKQQAQKGFARENRQKIPLDAPNRSYKDANHKPELICALTPFWALKGFRETRSMIALLDVVACKEISAELIDFKQAQNRDGLRSFFGAIMTMADARKKVLVDVVATAARERRFDDNICRWINTLNAQYPGDIGVISPLLMNLVCLAPGEALFLQAGEPHAYFEGMGMEIMANSDNVLRGGCTKKFVAIPELMNVLTFTPGDTVILKGDQVSPVERIYNAPVQEFRLSAITVREGLIFKKGGRSSVEIIMCVQGFSRIVDSETNQALDLQKGVSCIVPAAVKEYELLGASVLYKASIPL